MYPYRKYKNHMGAVGGIYDKMHFEVFAFSLMLGSLLVLHFCSSFFSYCFEFTLFCYVLFELPPILLEQGGIRINT